MYQKNIFRLLGEIIMKNNSKRNSIIVIGGLVLFVGVSALAVPKLTQIALAKTTEKVIREESATTNNTIPVTKFSNIKPSSTVTEYFEETITSEEREQLIQISNILLDFSNDRAMKSGLWTESLKMSIPDIFQLAPDEAYQKVLYNTEVAFQGMELSDFQKRELILYDQYVYDGLRPNAIIKLGAGQPDEMYFDYENNTIHWPEGREWTDEDTLQYIDINYRMNYIYSINDDMQSPDEFEHKLSQQVQKVSAISEEEAKKQAIALLSNMVELDTDNKDIEISYMFLADGPSYISQKDYPLSSSIRVSFKPYRTNTLIADQIDFHTYSASYRLSDGKLAAINLGNRPVKDDDIVFIQKNTQELQNDQNLMNFVTNFIKNGLNDQREIVNITVIGADEASGNDQFKYAQLYGMVPLVVRMDDNSGYTINVYYDKLYVVEAMCSDSADAIMEEWKNPTVFG